MLYTTEVQQGSAAKIYKHDVEVGCTVCGIPAQTSVYTKWGSSSCSANSELIYAGWMAGADHGHHGSGANTLCMTLAGFETPFGASTGNHDGNLLYGTEYEVGKNVNG